MSRGQFGRFVVGLVGFVGLVGLVVVGVFASGALTNLVLALILVLVRLVLTPFAHF